MIKKLKNIIFYIRYKRAVKTANNRHELTKMTYYVLIYDGKPFVVAKQQVKEWIYQSKLKKGITINQVQQGALYIAN